MATDITKFSVTTTAQVAAADARRRSIFLQNQSDTDLYVAFGNANVTGPSGASPGIKILANGGTLAAAAVSPWDQSLDGPIHAIHAGTGSKVLVIHEQKM